MDMHRRWTLEYPRRGSALKSVAWVAGLIATAAAVAVAAVFALLLAGAVVVLGVIGSLLAALTAAALRARRVRTEVPVLIEARKVGHQWVAYGWDQRAR